jgi:DNA damage-binding protein 1
VRGWILVFVVEDGRLQLIVEKEMKGDIYSLNAFNEKLLAAINQKIQLYKWMAREDGSQELQSNCGHHGHILALYTKTRGDFIVVGGLIKSISLLAYKVRIFTVYKNRNAATDEERGRLEVVGVPIYLRLSIRSSSRMLWASEVFLSSFF